MSEKQAKLGEKRAPARPLTRRQRQVLDLVARGRGNKAIANELGISEQATKEHVSTLLRRLGAPNRAALAEAATQLEILGASEVDAGLLRYLFRSAPIGILILRGIEHLVIAANDAVLRLTSGRQVTGLPVRDAFPAAAGRIVPVLDTAYRSGEPHVEHEFGVSWDRRGRGPEPGFISFAIEPVRDDAGNVGSMVVFTIDVTDVVVDRRRLERLNAEELAIFDLMREGVVVADAEGRLVKINDAARRIAGFTDDIPRIDEERFAPFNLRDAGGRPLPLAEVPLVRALAGETVPWADYLLFNAARGADVRLRISATPMRAADGSIIGGVVVYRPVRAE